MPPRISKNTSVRIHLDWSRLRSVLRGYGRFPARSGLTPEAASTGSRDHGFMVKPMRVCAVNGTNSAPSGTMSASWPAEATSFALVLRGKRVPVACLEGTLFLSLQSSSKERNLKVTQRREGAEPLVTEWPRLLRGALGHYRYWVELYDYPNSEDDHDYQIPQTQL
jgi:hypothetical protein